MRNAETALANLEREDPGTLARVYLVHGAEPYYMARLVRAVRRHSLDPSQEAFNYTFLEHDRATVAEVWSAVRTPPLLSPCRLVVARDPAELAPAIAVREPGGDGAEEVRAGHGSEGDGSGEAGGHEAVVESALAGVDHAYPALASAPDAAAVAPDAAALAPGETVRRWCALLEVVPPDSRLVLAFSRELPPAHPLLKAAGLQPAVDVVRCLPATSKSAEVWVRRLAAGLGGTIDEDASQALVLRSGTDLSVLEREVEKLLAYSGGNRVTAADVGEAATPSAEASVFEMVDHIGGRRPYQAVQKLRRLVEQGEPPLRLTAMVVRQVRLIFLAHELLATGASVRAIEDRFKLPTWVVRSYLSQAKNYTREQLAGMLRSLGRLDLDVKTGRREAVAALELFILQQCA